MVHTLRQFLTVKSCVALLGLTALLGLSACATVPTATGSGQSGSASMTSQLTASPTPTQTPSNSTTNLAASLPLLQKSVQALSQIQSVHIDAKGHGSLQGSPAQLAGGGANSTYQLSAHSDVLVPKQEEQGRITVTLAPTNTVANPTTLQASEVFAGQHLYIRVGAAKTWQVVDFTPQTQNAAKGLPAAQQFLQLTAQHISIVDHGVSTTGQQRLHHLTMTLDQQNAQALASLLPQPMLKQALGAVTLQQPLTVDLFINEATALPARIMIAGQVNVAAALGTSGTNQQGNVSGQARTIQASFSLTITLSKYNRRVQIRVPAPSQQAQPGVAQP